MTQDLSYAAMSKNDLIRVIETQQQTILYEREKRQWYEQVLGNKALPINQRLALIAVKRLGDTRQADDDGWRRAYLPALGEMVGVSPSSISRGLKNLNDCTDVIEHRNVPDPHEPYKSNVFIRSTDLLDRPAEITPTKEIKRHGGDHRIVCQACGSDDIVEKKQHICRCCGTVVKAFDLREVNSPQEEDTPLQDARGTIPTHLEPEAGVVEPEAGVVTDPLQDATASFADLPEVLPQVLPTHLEPEAAVVEPEAAVVTDPLQDATASFADLGEPVTAVGEPVITDPLQLATGESEREEVATDDQGRCRLQPLLSHSVVSDCTVEPPPELRDLPIWVCHRAKEPFETRPARSPQMAKCNDPKTWGTYAQALATLEDSQSWKYPYDGLAFACNGSFTVIDHDHIIDEQGDIAQMAAKRIAAIDSYGEISYSRTGVHQIAKGTIPRNIKQPGIEMYNHDHFITWTGQHLSGTPGVILDRQEQLHALFAEIAPPAIERPAPDTTVYAPCPLADEEVLEKARNGKYGERFIRLFDDGCFDGYTSQSEADLALCNDLAYWSDSDAAMVDKLFRQSKLYREEKWDRKARAGETYGEGTIRRAIGSRIAS